MTTPATAGPPVLPGMFDDSQRPRRHKRARQTSREVYRLRRDQDIAAAHLGRETRQGAVLRCLAAFWNRHQYSPTAYELLTFALEQGERFRDVNILRPRLTELVHLGLIEPRSKRRCCVTGAEASTWAVREAGSQEPRP